MKYVTKDELEQIKNKALNTKMYKGQRAYLIIETLSRTGVRVHELIKITCSDLRNNQLIVRGKGNIIRNIDIDSNLYFMLKTHCKQKGMSSNSRIFDLTRNGVYKLCKKICGLNPHAFRHSYAIELLRVTKNIRYVQLQLGHSTMKTTEIYLRYMEYESEKNKIGELYQ